MFLSGLLNVDYTRSAVLLIDMQTDFVDALRVGAAETIIPQQERLIQTCVRFDIPLFSITYNGCGEIVAPIQACISNVPRCVTVAKANNNSFTNDKLKDALRDLCIAHVILAGINAGMCVMETAQAALKYGFTISTAGDLIAGKAYHRVDDYQRWYRSNGTYFTETKLLLGTLRHAFS